VIVADTGAILALIDADDRHHGEFLALYEDDPGSWVLPWAILAEVDYLLLTHVGADVERAFANDLATGGYAVEWGEEADLTRARDLCERYRSLRLGLVDAVVVAVAERLRADAIATVDLRHLGAIEIKGTPRLLPRDRGGSRQPSAVGRQPSEGRAQFTDG
jgi:predicted nucleic acid-binding protein